MLMTLCNATVTRIIKSLLKPSKTITIITDVDILILIYPFTL